VCAGIVSVSSAAQSEPDAGDAMALHAGRTGRSSKGRLPLLHKTADISRHGWRRSDTTRLPLYLLVGEFAYPARDDTRDLARRINGASDEHHGGLGHFPMSEHPEKFLTYLMPVLDEIRVASRFRQAGGDDERSGSARRGGGGRRSIAVAQPCAACDRAQSLNRLPRSARAAVARDMRQVPAVALQ